MCRLPSGPFFHPLVCGRETHSTAAVIATTAHVVIVANPGSPWVPRPNALRVKVNFLSDPTAFEKLIAIPEKAVHDPELAAKLFPKWVEGNETVFTNTLPMRWVAVVEEPTPATTPARRRRGGS